MEFRRIDVLPINLTSFSNAPNSSVNKPKTSPNISFNLNIQRKKEEIIRELEKIFRQLDKFLERINQLLDPLKKELRVEIDAELNIPIFKIINKETNEVIRQIPLEEILRIIKNLEKFLESQKIKKEYLKGILLNTEV